MIPVSCRTLAVGVYTYLILRLEEFLLQLLDVFRHSIPLLGEHPELRALEGSHNCVTADC